MAKDKLHAHIVLDRSGSMNRNLNSVISAVNEYVSAVASDKDTDARISLTLFDSDHRGVPRIDTVVDNARVSEWKPLTNRTYMPAGGTPLNDAIGKVVCDMQKAKLRSGERVAIVVMTDGLENSSKEFTKETIKSLLKTREEDGWLVLYLGANQDAFAESAARGLSMGTTMNFTEGAYLETMDAAAASTMRYAKSGDVRKAAFTEQERSSAMGSKARARSL